MSNRTEMSILVVLLVSSGVLLIDAVVDGESMRVLLWSALLLAVGWSLMRARREQTDNE